MSLVMPLNDYFRLHQASYVSRFSRYNEILQRDQIATCAMSALDSQPFRAADAILPCVLSQPCQLLSIKPASMVTTRSRQ
jgi:hypothetical protein